MRAMSTGFGCPKCDTRVRIDIFIVKGEEVSFAGKCGGCGMHCLYAFEDTLAHALELPPRVIFPGRTLH